jgi:hypothetical protein
MDGGLLRRLCLRRGLDVCGRVIGWQVPLMVTRASAMQFRTCYCEDRRTRTHPTYPHAAMDAEFQAP